MNDVENAGIPDQGLPTGEQITGESPPPNDQDQDQDQDKDQDQDQEEDHRKVPRSFQKRIDELTREKYEERRSRERLEALVEKLIAQPGASQAGSSQAQPQQSSFQPPKPEDYPAGRYDPDYQEALSDYKIKLHLQSIEQQFNQRQAQEAQQREFVGRQKAFQAKEAEYIRLNPEYESARDIVLNDERIADNAVLGHAILDSEMPAQIIHYLGTHPDEIEKIATLGNAAVVRYIGRLEERLSGQSPAASSKAPNPISSIKGKTAQAPKSSDDARDQKEYERLRREEMKRAGLVR